MKFVAEAMRKVVGEEHLQESMDQVVNACHITRKNLSGDVKMKVSKQAQVSEAIYNASGVLVDYCEVPHDEGKPEVMVLIEDWYPEGSMCDTPEPVDEYDWEPQYV